MNHRKGKDFRGELLVLYTTGQREWCYLHGALQEAPTFVLDYMDTVGIDYPIMGYDILDPDLLDANTDCPFIRIAEEIYDPIDKKQESIPVNNTELNDIAIAIGTCIDTPVNNDADMEKERDFQNDDLTIAAALVDCGNVSVNVTGTLGTDLLLCNDFTTNDPNDKELDINATTSNTTKAKAINMEAKPVNDSEQKQACKCPFNHSDFHNLIPESDSRYCFKGRDFDGVHCAIPTCNKLFVHCTKGKTDCVRPTDKHPLYACENRRDKCPYAICFECNSNLLLNYVRKTK